MSSLAPSLMDDTDEVRALNRQDSELFNFAADLARKHAAEITADPLKAAKADYAQLKAHYKMVFDAGNKLLAEAQKKNGEALNYLSEAQAIGEQMNVLERLYPEACR